MKADDEFDGLMEITHGDDNDQPKETTDSNEDFLATDPTDATPAPSAESTNLAERLDKLEADFAEYKAHNEKKLAILEKIAKKQQLTPQERVFMIQEEA